MKVTAQTIRDFLEKPPKTIRFCFKRLIYILRV